jgi:hypothetical protein
MRWLAGCVVIALLIGVGPLAAEQEAPAREAAVAPTAAAEAPGEPPAAAGPLELSALPLLEQLPPPPAPPPPITLVLNTDLGAQRLTVIENGKTRHVWPISSGRAGYATTTGTFHPQWASRMWHSRQYDYAPMPHAVFFHRGTAFHGTSAVGLLGRPASHGCIRLAPGNAATLFKLVHRHGYAQTKVVVHNGAKGKGRAVAAQGEGRRKSASARAEPRRDARVGRYNARPSAYRPD